MEDGKTTGLEEELLGVALNALIARVPLGVMDRHFHRDGRTKVSPRSPGYPCLLREAIEDIKAAVIEQCGVPVEVVRTWGPIGMRDALAAVERLNELSAERAEATDELA